MKNHGRRWRGVVQVDFRGLTSLAAEGSAKLSLSGPPVWLIRLHRRCHKVAANVASWPCLTAQPPALPPLVDRLQGCPVRQAIERMQSPPHPARRGSLGNQAVSGTLRGYLNQSSCQAEAGEPNPPYPLDTTIACDSLLC
jgi:hypothetical protein